MEKQLLFFKTTQNTTTHTTSTRRRRQSQAKDSFFQIFRSRKTFHAATAINDTARLTHSENTPDSNTLQRRRGRTRLLTKTLHSATLRLQRLHQQRRSLTQHLTHVSPFFLSLQSKYVYNAAIVSGIACHFVLQKLQQQHQRDYSQESKGETTLQ